jgi:CRP-like cAMP-binding protein
MTKVNDFKKFVKNYPDLWEKIEYPEEMLITVQQKILSRNYYLESGIVELFVYNESDLKEITIDFFFSDDILLPYAHKFEDIEEIMNLKVLEDAVLYSINSQNWEKLMAKESAELNEIIRQDSCYIAEKFIKKSLIRSYSKTEKRYQAMLEIYPELIRVGDSKIASFLGVDRTTINRIKNKK